MNKRMNYVLALSVLLAVPAAADTVKGKVGTDKVYEFTADRSTAARITAMWAKSGSDVDVGVFSDSSAVGIGVATAERYEAVVFGALTGTTYAVVVTKFIGPNTNFFLRVTTDGEEGTRRASRRGARPLKLRYVGELWDLALTDPYYEAIESELFELRESKRAMR